jgi:hypothetical protein
MAIQTKLGKAFEFACLQSLYNHLSDSQTIMINETNALNTARKSFNNADESTQINMTKGANAATRIILKLEPQLEQPLKNIPFQMNLNSIMRI